jgi:prevent-host-death family protein
MTRIGVRELRQHASRYLDEVKAGGRVEVTERGELVAILVPPTDARTARDRAVGSGRLVPAAGAWQLPVRRAAVAGEESASDTLEALRDERLG